jgi:inosose dehydratase
MERSKDSSAPSKREGLLGRVAGAPISWGVCEVPGWGYQMAPGRVLAEIAEVGFAATELGPRGFLPEEPERLEAVMSHHGLRVVAGFVPALLHVPARLDDELRGIDASARALRRAGAGLLVLAAASGGGGYEAGAALEPAGWSALGRALAAAEEVAARNGLELAVHPHVGTVIEGAEQVARLLQVSSVGLCLDIGHLAVAGADAIEVARLAAGRVRHVHLKDVDAATARRVRSGELGYRDAVRAGLYTPLGQGAGRVAELVRLLESHGYRGWYVLEQDVVLSSNPPLGRGPVEEVGRSLDFLKALAA